MFSDEILENFTVSSDILSPSSDSSLPTEETTEFLDETSEISDKSERHKADLGRLLALKSSAVEENSDWQKINLKEIIENQKDKDEEHDCQCQLPFDEIAPKSDSVDCLQNESISETLASTVQSSLFTPSCPIDVEKDVVIAQGDVIPEDIFPEINDSEDVISEDDSPENDVPEDVVEEDVALEETVPEDVVEEDVSFEETVPEETSELPSEDDVKSYTVHPAHTDYPSAHNALSQRSLQTLKMQIPLDAVISRRSFSVADILRWKPGSVIEFDDIEPTIILESNGVALGRGKPIEQNLRIGIQLE